MSLSASANQLTKPKSGGLLLLRRRAPLSRRTVAYFCSGAHNLWHSCRQGRIDGRKIDGERTAATEFALKPNVTAALLDDAEHR
jgi:hypothetical protein